MTEYHILRSGRKVGIVDVTNKGVSILSDSGKNNLIQYMGSEFNLVRTKIMGKVTEYVYSISKPATNVMQVLVRLQAALEGSGYEIST